MANTSMWTGSDKYICDAELAQAFHMSRVLGMPLLMEGEPGTGKTELPIQFAKDNNIELTIVGPEAPLVDGVVDAFSEAGLHCFGPTQGAAQLEGSKAFTKDFLARHNIPTGAYANFTDVDAALAYVRQQGAPIVVKADGLAAGKGVIVAMTLEEAEEAIKDMLAGNAFGSAGSRVVIEEFLDGEEASFIVMVDGKNVLPMATSQDHKRVGDKDTGPNTGGMGAYSPAPVVTQEIHDRIMQEVIYPTVEGMAAEGNPYTGFLYAGLMIDAAGTPKVIEYNVRMGDPETEAVMLRIKSDFVDLLEGMADGNLAQKTLEIDERSAATVMLVSGGYPGSYENGKIMTGFKDVKDSILFHAGTKNSGSEVVTNGGRVIAISSYGNNFHDALQKSYENASKIKFDGVYFRKDIGFDL